MIMLRLQVIARPQSAIIFDISSQRRGPNIMAQTISNKLIRPVTAAIRSSNSQTAKTSSFSNISHMSSVLHWPHSVVRTSLGRVKNNY